MCSNYRQLALWRRRRRRFILITSNYDIFTWRDAAESSSAFELLQSGWKAVEGVFCRKEAAFKPPPPTMFTLRVNMKYLLQLRPRAPGLEQTARNLKTCMSNVLSGAILMATLPPPRDMDPYCVTIASSSSVLFSHSHEVLRIAAGPSVGGRRRRRRRLRL